MCDLNKRPRTNQRDLSPESSLRHEIESQQPTERESVWTVDCGGQQGGQGEGVGQGRGPEPGQRHGPGAGVRPRPGQQKLRI